MSASAAPVGMRGLPAAARPRARLSAHTASRATGATSRALAAWCDRRASTAWNRSTQRPCARLRRAARHAAAWAAQHPATAVGGAHLCHYLQREGELRPQSRPRRARAEVAQAPAAHARCRPMARLLDVPRPTIALGVRDRAIMELLYSSRAAALRSSLGLDLADARPARPHRARDSARAARRASCRSGARP